MLLNRGRGNYPFKNHISTCERRPEISEYNAYITNYLAKPKQIENFDRSNGTLIEYEDLVGNSHINNGPTFGHIVATDNLTPTTAPTVNNVDFEL